MQWNELTPLSEANLNDLEARITQATTNVDNGKSEVAQAITTMGQTASASDSFTVLSNKIKDISKDANAAAGDALSGKTFYSGGVKRTGTMPNKTGTSATVGWSNGNADTSVDLTPPAGYYDGSTATLSISDPDLVSGNIRAGVNIFGVAGHSYVVNTGDAVLDPQYLLTGQSGYDDGVKKNGTMPNRSAENNHMPALEHTVWTGDRVFLRPPNGYYTGSSWVTAPAPTFTPSNIASGVNILGVVGTLPVRLFANGSIGLKLRDADGWWRFSASLGWQPTVFGAYLSIDNGSSVRIASIHHLDVGALPSWWSGALWNMEIQSFWNSAVDVTYNSGVVNYQTNDIPSGQQCAAQWFAFRI